jgi:single-strand DNA-binding protein
MNINSCTVSGRLTADSELRQSGSGTSFCNFRIAVNDRRTDDVMYLNVVSFGKQAEALSKILVKGCLVGVSGKLKIDTYEKDGVKRDSVSIIANDVELGPKKSGSSEE